MPVGHRRWHSELSPMLIPREFVILMNFLSDLWHVFFLFFGGGPFTASFSRVNSPSLPGISNASSEVVLSLSLYN